MTAERLPTSKKQPPHDAEMDDLSIEYPFTDGEPMAEDDAQLTAMIYAISSLRAWFADREDVYAGGDMLMYYRMNDNETRVAPDVFVVVGVASRHRRRSWITWREGRSPDFVIELASGSTWRRDMVAKRDIYAEMGVLEYWRFDPSGDYFSPPLVGELLEDGQYTGMPLATDDGGILRGHSAVLGLDVCVMPDGNLRFYDPVGRQLLRTLGESEAALRTAEEELRVLREQLQSYQAGEQA